MTTYRLTGRPSSPVPALTDLRIGEDFEMSLVEAEEAYLIGSGVIKRVDAPDESEAVAEPVPEADAAPVEPVEWVVQPEPEVVHKDPRED